MRGKVPMRFCRGSPHAAQKLSVRILLLASDLDLTKDADADAWFPSEFLLQPRAACSSRELVEQNSGEHCSLVRLLVLKKNVYANYTRIAVFPAEWTTRTHSCYRAAYMAFLGCRQFKAAPTSSGSVYSCLRHNNYALQARGCASTIAYPPEPYIPSKKVAPVMKKCLDFYNRADADWCRLLLGR